RRGATAARARNPLRWSTSSEHDSLLLIEATIGDAVELSGICRVSGRRAGPDREVQLGKGNEQSTQTLGERQNFGALGIGQNDGEFVPAQPGGGVPSTNRAAQ